MHINIHCESHTAVTQVIDMAQGPLVAFHILFLMILIPYSNSISLQETAGLPNMNKKYPLGGSRIRMSICAGDLIGKTVGIKYCFIQGVTLWSIFITTDYP